MSCDIAVSLVGEGIVYPCAHGKSIDWAERQIRKTYNTPPGSVLCDGVGADESDLIEFGKAYRFVGGSIQSKKSSSVSHS